MKDIFIYGAGGFGREIACLINRINKKKPEWNIVGFLDDGKPIGYRNEYGEVVGNIDFINSHLEEISVVFAIGNPNTLNKLTSSITNPKIAFPNVIDPDVLFLDEKNVHMGKGNVICAKCVVSCNVELGHFNLFNIGVGIGHDTKMGNCNVIMPNVNISGGVVISDQNFLGVKSTVLQYLKIGNKITLGANSLLIRNPKDNMLYMGSPAKKIEI